MLPLNHVKEADCEILTAIGLCPKFGEQVLALYLKNSVQLPPGTILADALQPRRLSPEPGYRNAVNQAEPANNELAPITQSTLVGEDRNIGQAGPSQIEWYQVEGVHSIQGPYFSRQAPQSGPDHTAPIGDDHIVYEEQSFYQYQDEADYDEQLFYHQHQDETAIITNTEASLSHQQGPRSVLPTDECKDYVEQSYKQTKIGASSNRRRNTGSQASSHHGRALRSATKVRPKKERNYRVERSRVQNDRASCQRRPQTSKYEADVSKIHFYCLEEHKVWKQGDRLHIPINGLLHNNQKKPVEGVTVIMTYISVSAENKRASLWKCSCVGVNGGYLPGSLPFFEAI